MSIKALALTAIVAASGALAYVFVKNKNKSANADNTDDGVKYSGDTTSPVQTKPAQTKSEGGYETETMNPETSVGPETDTDTEQYAANIETQYGYGALLPESVYAECVSRGLFSDRLITTADSRWTREGGPVYSIAYRQNDYSNGNWSVEIKLEKLRAKLKTAKKGDQYLGYYLSETDVKKWLTDQQNGFINSAIDQNKKDEVLSNQIATMISTASAFNAKLSSQKKEAIIEMMLTLENFIKTLEKETGTIATNGIKNVQKELDKMKKQYDSIVATESTSEKEKTDALNTLKSLGLVALTAEQIQSYKDLKAEGKNMSTSYYMSYRANSPAWQKLQGVIGLRYESVMESATNSNKVANAERVFIGIEPLTASSFYKELTKCFKNTQNSEQYNLNAQAERDKKLVEKSEQDKKDEKSSVDRAKTSDSRIGAGGEVPLLVSDIEILAKNFKLNNCTLEDVLGGWRSLPQDKLPTEDQMTHIRYFLEQCWDKYVGDTFGADKWRNCVKNISFQTIQTGGVIITFNVNVVEYRNQGGGIAKTPGSHRAFVSAMQLNQNFDYVNYITNSKQLQIAYVHGNNRHQCLVDGKSIGTSGSPLWIDYQVKFAQMED